MRKRARIVILSLSVFISVSCLYACNTKNEIGELPSPSIGNKSTASGSAANGAVMGENNNVERQQAKNQASIVEKDIVEFGNAVDDLVLDDDTYYQNTKYRYQVSWKHVYHAHIYQSTLDGKKTTDTGIQSKYLDVLFVNDKWLYYQKDETEVYRVPIVKKKNGEKLDEKNQQCMVKEDFDGSIVDNKKLYYFTFENVHKAKSKKKGDLVIHLLDFKTGEKKSSKQPIKYVQDYDIGNYEFMEQDCRFFVTQKYIFFYCLFPRYIYQVNKENLEVKQIDSLNCSEEDDEVELQVSKDGNYICYEKTIVEGENCDVQIWCYNVRKQKKKCLCNRKKLLDYICRTENKKSQDIASVSFGDLVAVDSNKVYVEYYMDKLDDLASGLIECSIKEDKMQILTELLELYQTDFYLFAYLRKDGKILYESMEDEEWATFDLQSKMLEMISEGRAETLKDKNDIWDDVDC